jgi:hypothetical protein
VGLLGREETAGHAFHITSDEVLTWDAIYREAAHAAGVEPAIVHVASDWIAAKHPAFEGTLLGDKAHSAVFDNAKIKKFVPEFACTVPWAIGVRRAVAWFEQDPARRTIDEAHNRVLDGLLQAYQSPRGPHQST